jgi:hypothetical protein
MPHADGRARDAWYALFTPGIHRSIIVETAGRFSRLSAIWGQEQADGPEGSVGYPVSSLLPLRPIARGEVNHDRALHPIGEISHRGWHRNAPAEYWFCFFVNQGRNAYFISGRYRNYVFVIHD